MTAPTTDLQGQPESVATLAMTTPITGLSQHPGTVDVEEQAETPATSRADLSQVLCQLGQNELTT